MALFEETDVLCVADREGGRVECIRAGLQKTLHANRDDTGKRVVNYREGVGRPYAIAAKGIDMFHYEAKLVQEAEPGTNKLCYQSFKRKSFFLSFFCTNILLYRGTNVFISKPINVLYEK